MKHGFRRLSRRVALPAITLALAATALAEEARPEPATLEPARRAIDDFATALKSELMSALKAGGPVQAIEVCSRRAGAIAAEVSGRHGLRLKRTARKFRNPDNAPTAWQREVLESFEARIEAGEDAASMEWYESVGAENHRQFRYMRPIVTGGPCLQCHGRSLRPDVKEQLEALYPRDRATGFERGEIRGAFVVTDGPGTR